MRQNDTGNEFFIIIEGTADITKTTTNGTEHVGELGPRYVFIYKNRLPRAPISTLFKPILANFQFHGNGPSIN